MRRFSFNLESVLIVRKKALEDARIRLASITNILNKQKEILNEMIFELEKNSKQSEKLLEEGYFNLDLIASFNAFSNKLINDIKNQKEKIKKTKIDFEKCQNEAKEAYIKVKSLENLKEKKKLEYKKESELEEIKTIDDIVNSRRKTA